ncbi:MAG: response regulator [Candidatus Binatia bacterium]
MPLVRKILLVDDHETILMILERLLEQPCVAFLRAGSGDEALAVVREEHPDVVLLDVCMPGMDGLEVCEAIKSDPDLADVRVILMSAIIGENGLQESSSEVRADGYVGKPFNPDLVRQGVAAMLAMNRGDVPEH